jgi:hypothetical protein
MVKKISIATVVCINFNEKIFRLWTSGETLGGSTKKMKWEIKKLLQFSLFIRETKSRSARIQKIRRHLSAYAAQKAWNKKFLNK